VTCPQTCPARGYGGWSTPLRSPKYVILSAYQINDITGIYLGGGGGEQATLQLAGLCARSRITTIIINAIAYNYRRKINISMTIHSYLENTIKS
jgi:hypothetical protein